MEKINDKKFEKSVIEKNALKNVVAGLDCDWTNYQTQSITTTFWLFEDTNTVTDSKIDNTCAWANENRYGVSTRD